METAASFPRRAHGLVLPRVGAGLALGCLVALSAVVRTGLAWAKVTPIYWPDEYMYAELGRSLAASGRPLVRGGDASFPALLQPLLTAPAWLIDDVGLAYRAVQLEASVAMSLAAIPAFVLARRLELGPRLSLGVAALALAIPDFIYSSWILSEPFAYPLVLAAVAAATVAIGTGSRRAQLAFVAFAGLAAFTRVQLLALVACYAVAVLVVAGRARRPAVLRRHWFVLAPVVGGVALVLAPGAAPLAGIYSGATIALDLHALARNVVGLLYASGWALAPAAALGLALGLARPRSDTELAFCAVALTTVAALVVQAAVYGDTDRIQERYFFYAFPLAALGFALHAARGWPQARGHAALAGALVAVSAAVPLAGYAAVEGKTQSPFLVAAFRIQTLVGEPGAGSLAIAGAAGVVAVTVAAAAFRPALATRVVLVLSLAVSAVWYAGASSFDVANARGVRGESLPAERSWVDRHGLRDVAVLSALGRRSDAFAQLFWNRSITDVVVMPGAKRLDAFRTLSARVGRDGTLTVGGRPLRRPLVVDDYAALFRFRGVRLAAEAPLHRLWVPRGTPRLELYVPGYYRAGWLAMAGTFNVWATRPGSRVSGYVSFTVRALDGEGPVGLRLERRGRTLESFTLAPSTSRTVTLRVCGTGFWSARFAADQGFVAGGRALSVRSSEPAWRPDVSACAGTSPAIPGEA